MKSEEQRLLEAATEEYVSKLQAIFGKRANAVIQIAGVPLTKLAAIIEPTDNHEIKSDGDTCYIYTRDIIAKPELFEIDFISE